MRCLIAVLLALGPAVALAWGATGHRVTGALAEPLLAPASRERVAAILGVETLAEASTWADEMRADPAPFWQETASPWHYVTVPRGAPYRDVGAPHEGEAFTALEEEFRALKSGKSGRMHIAIECHACYDWLFPVLEAFRKRWGDVDVDIRPGLAFDALPALRREEVDVVISSDPEELEGITFSPLFDYEPVFVAAHDHPLAAKDHIVAEDLRDETLITYPVDRSRLDVFTELLTPARVEPRAVRQVELTAVILLLVAAGRGVSVLPDWVLRELRTSTDYITRPLTENGVTKRLYAATRSEETTKPFMADMLRLGREIPVRLQRGD